MKRKIIAASIIAALSSTAAHAEVERRSIMELFSSKDKNEVAKIENNHQKQEYTNIFDDMNLTSFETLTQKYQNDQVIIFYLASKDMENKEIKLALQKYIKAANLGLPEAVHNVISLLYMGYGSESEIKDSITFLEKSAISGDVKAQTYLGRVYTDGTIEGKEKEGVFWYKKAADKNHEEAVYTYGSMLLTGKMAPQNGVEAYKYLSRIANKNVLAAKNLAIAYDFGMALEPNYANALKFYKMASEMGDTESTYRIGQMYYHGKGTDKNLKAAQSYLGKAYSSGVKDAGYELALTYLELNESNDSNKLAVEFLVEAANVYGNKKAQTKLGDLHSSEDYPELFDMKEAVKWYEKASDMGDAPASRRLYFIYAEGAEGVKADHKKSQYYLKQSLNDRDNINLKVEPPVESFIELYDR